MRRTPHEPEPTATGLLSLAEGEDLGAVLLRLAHRAAAQHRLEAVRQAVAMGGGEAHDTPSTAQRAGSRS